MDGSNEKMISSNWGTALYPEFNAPNKFIFLNRNIITNSHRQYLPTFTNKILINPKFKQNVHVNPHFNKITPTSSTSIFINPNIIKQSTSQIDNKCVTSFVPITKSSINSSDLNRRNLEAKLPPTVTKPVEKEIKGSKGALIKNTRTQLVRASRLNSPKMLIKSQRKSTDAPVKFRQKVCSRYKLIRRSLSNDWSITEGAKKRIYYIKTRYKIDKASPKIKQKQSKESSSSVKLLRKRRYSFNLLNSLNTRNIYIKRNLNLSKMHLVNVTGLLHGSSLNTFKKTNKLLNTAHTKQKREKIIIIRGQKYKLDASHRTLTCLSTTEKASGPSVATIHIGGITFKQKEPNIFVKADVSRRRVSLSQAKEKSINVLVNRMRKCNVPCPFYRKFGKCRGKENGRCNRIHNPDQISLCSKFLQGACINEKCLLSHKVSPEKMPTCKFFLEGLCTRENCQYLHVKINANADICKDFLEGFCKSGRECDKRHQYLCPDFEKLGTCPRRRCAYPHVTVVRKRRIPKNVASKSSECCKADTEEKESSDEIPLQKISSKLCDKVEANVETGFSKARYYIDVYGSNSDHKFDSDNNVDVPCSGSDSSDNEVSAKRPKLGDLPSFIPFEND